jgi:hypothetical protein
VLWSPSLFFPQNIAASLKPITTYPGFLHFGLSQKIGTTLAKELDQLDTRKHIPHITKPYITYLTVEDSGHDIWNNVIDIPFRHDYTPDQLLQLWDMTQDYLKSN